MDALGTDFTIACPAFPATRRTIYQGYLFVSGVLLNESGMQHHPLTPMTDANLVRVLQQQTKRKVGLVDSRCRQQLAASQSRSGSHGSVTMGTDWRSSMRFPTPISPRSAWQRRT